MQAGLVPLNPEADFAGSARWQTYWCWPSRPSPETLIAGKDFWSAECLDILSTIGPSDRQTQADAFLPRITPWAYGAEISCQQW
jgi:hypothetical protein